MHDILIESSNESESKNSLMKEKLEQALKILHLNSINVLDDDIKQKLNQLYDDEWKTKRRRKRAQIAANAITLLCHLDTYMEDALKVE